MDRAADTIPCRANRSVPAIVVQRGTFRASPRCAVARLLCTTFSPLRTVRWQTADLVCYDPTPQGDPVRMRVSVFGRDHVGVICRVG